MRITTNTMDDVELNAYGPIFRVFMTICDEHMRNDYLSIG